MCYASFGKRTAFRGALAPFSRIPNLRPSDTFKFKRLSNSSNRPAYWFGSEAYAARKARATAQFVTVLSL
jgi:hypothetical protein